MRPGSRLFLTILPALVLLVVTTGAALAQGSVIGWGDNESGQSTPPPALTGVVMIAAGLDHGVALKGDGTVVGWGSNDYGQATPPPGLSGVTAIAAGGYFSLALKSDGTIVGWGDNRSGQLTPPPGLADVAMIAAGKYHSLALKHDGTVVGWGSDDLGRATPPAGLSGVVEIGGGELHSVALKSDGSIVAWGDNRFGQATPPAGLRGVVRIAVGLDHNLALKSDGTVVGWGANDNGQATPPPGLSGVVGIAAGGSLSMALESNGTVVEWGNNLRGGATPPSGLSGVVKVAAGWYHSLALIADTATLTVNPSAQWPGGPLTFTGSGFTPRETVFVTCRTAGSPILMASTSADGSGAITGSARIPAIPAGPSFLTARGTTSGRFGATGLRVTPRLIVSPNAGPAGSTATVEGYGFTAGETVSVVWQDRVVPLGKTAADSSGHFPAVTVTIPTPAAPGANWVLGLGSASFGNLLLFAASSFTVQ